MKPMMQDGIEPKNPLDLGIPGGRPQCRQRLRGRRQRSQHRHDRLGRRCCRARPAPGTTSNVPAYLNGDRQADRRLRPHELPDDARAVEAQKQAGFPFLQGLEPTIRALNALWFHAAAHAAERPAAPPPAPPSDLTPATLDATLKRYGIALPQSREVATAAEAAAAAEAIGFPVVLKIRSADILHKTEAGGVALDLREPDDVAGRGRRAHRLGAQGVSERPHRRLPGAGDGVRHRGDRRRAQRPALRSDAAGRRRRHPGRARQGRGAAPAAGRRSRRDRDDRRPQAQQAARRLSRPARRRPRRAGDDRARARRNSISITARGSTTSRSIR